MRARELFFARCREMRISDIAVTLNSRETNIYDEINYILAAEHNEISLYTVGSSDVSFPPGRVLIAHHVTQALARVILADYAFSPMILDQAKSRRLNWVDTIRGFQYSHCG